MLEASTALPPGLAGGSPAGRGTLLDPPLDIAAAVAVLAADAPARWRGPLLPPTAQGHQGNAHPLCGLSLREQVVIPQGLHPGYLRDLSLTLEITQGSLRASEMEVPRRMRQHPPRRGHEETASCPPHPLARPGATPPRRTRPWTSSTPSAAKPARPGARSPARPPTTPCSSAASPCAPAAPASSPSPSPPGSSTTASTPPSERSGTRSEAARDRRRAGRPRRGAGGRQRPAARAGPPPDERGGAARLPGRRPARHHRAGQAAARADHRRRVMTEPTVPAALVAGVLQLLADVVAEPRLDRAAARIEADGAVTPHAARQAAMANAAITVRVVLAGLLAGGPTGGVIGGVTVDGLDWAAGWLNRELADDEQQPLTDEGVRPGGHSPTEQEGT